MYAVAKQAASFSMSLRDQCDKEEPHQWPPGRPHSQPDQPAQLVADDAIASQAAAATAAATAAPPTNVAVVTLDLTSPQHTGPLLEVGFWADPQDAADERPDPARLVDEEWGGTATALAVALYARSGFLESFELGYSFCRLGCWGGGHRLRPIGGNRTTNDGGGDVFSHAAAAAEPAAAAATAGGGHKERKCHPHRHAPSSESDGPGHNKLMGCTTLTDGKYVWPEGLAHYISEHAVRPPEDFVKHSLKNLRALREAQAGGRLRWNVDETGNGRTARLAPGTAVFLRDKTTLGIALPTEPEIRKGHRSSGSSGWGLCSLCMAG